MDTLTIITLVVAGVGGLGGLAGFAALFRFRSQNKLDEAGASEKIASAAGRVADASGRFMQELADLRARVVRLERELDIYKRWNDNLIVQVCEAGKVPVPMPTGD